MNHAALIIAAVLAIAWGAVATVAGAFALVNAPPRFRFTAVVMIFGGLVTIYVGAALLSCLEHVQWPTPC